MASARVGGASRRYREGSSGELSSLVHHYYCENQIMKYQTVKSHLRRAVTGRMKVMKINFLPLL